MSTPPINPNQNLPCTPPPEPNRYTQVPGAPKINRIRTRETEPNRYTAMGEPPQKQARTLEKIDNIANQQIDHVANRRPVRRSLLEEFKQSWESGHCNPNKSNLDNQDPPNSPGSQGSLYLS